MPESLLNVLNKSNVNANEPKSIPRLPIEVKSPLPTSDTIPFNINALKAKPPEKATKPKPILPREIAPVAISSGFMFLNVHCASIKNPLNITKAGAATRRRGAAKVTFQDKSNMDLLIISMDCAAFLASSTEFL